MGSNAEAIEFSVEHALAQNELVYFYQPKVNLLSGQVCGAEALIRWLRCDAQVILPGSFLPALEASGTTHDLTLGMFDKLISDIAIINAVSPDLIISFNATAHDFVDNKLAKKLLLAVASSQIDPKKFQIELTETSLLDCSAVVQSNMQQVVDLGIALAMDDFGTGYSTVDVLSQWPFSIVKIDQGLVSRMQSNEKSLTIVHNCIQLAHQLGLRIVAEGVETEDVYDFLLKAGCSEVQGFLLAPPMPLDEFLSFLRTGKRWPGSPIGLIHMAQADHLQWRRYLIDYTVGKLYGESSFATKNVIHVESDPHLCSLGKWYYGIGRSYKGVVAYDALERPHNRLHALGDEIRDAIDRGVPRSDIIALLRQLTEASGEIIACLQELELVALLERGEGVA
jgi:EAL domain-containing protein (putative c-di-GMP-specific phosphodiesterase class I)